MHRFLSLFFLLAALLPAQPGKFDYYVLSLSWSPQFCAHAQGRQGAPGIQCAPGKRLGFVVHGLWPQFLPRGWPESCSLERGPSRQTIDGMLDLMPAPGLIRHEWEKHGTCDGSTPAQYFDKIRRAARAVAIPAEFQGPPRQVMVRPAELKRKFLQANPGAPPNSIGVVCGGNGGRFLSEVRVCLGKDLKTRACGQDVRDSCRVPEIIMPPVR